MHTPREWSETAWFLLPTSVSSWGQACTAHKLQWKFCYLVTAGMHRTVVAMLKTIKVEELLNSQATHMHTSVLQAGVRCARRLRKLISALVFVDMSLAYCSTTVPCPNTHTVPECIMQAAGVGCLIGKLFLVQKQRQIVVKCQFLPNQHKLNTLVSHNGLADQLPSFSCRRLSTS